MNFKTLLIFIVISSLLGVIAYKVFYSLPEHALSSRTEKKPTVVCTTTFIGDLAQQIAGDLVHVIVLMKPGIDPHTYKAQPQDVELLTKADVVLYHGLALEGKMAEVLGQLPQAYAVTDVLKAEQLLSVDEFFRIYDPHVWFDPLLWSTVALGLRVPLSRVLSDGDQIIKERIEQLTKDFQQLDARIKKLFDTIPAHKKILVTAHDAFGYFGKAYGFVVKGLQGLSTEAEVSVHDISELADFIVKRDIPVIFGETSVPRKALESVEQAVRAQGKSVILGPDLCSDSLGSSPDTNTYQAMMLNFAHTITLYFSRGDV